MIAKTLLVYIFQNPVNYAWLTHLRQLLFLLLGDASDKEIIKKLIYGCLGHNHNYGTGYNSNPIYLKKYPAGLGPPLELLPWPYLVPYLSSRVL